MGFMEWPLGCLFERNSIEHGTCGFMLRRRINHFEPGDRVAPCGPTVIISSKQKIENMCRYSGVVVRNPNKDAFLSKMNELKSVVSFLTRSSAVWDREYWKIVLQQIEEIVASA